MEAKLYTTDGEVIDKIPANGKYFTLEELQNFVGGYIEVIRLNSQSIMVLDEEGKFKQKPYNLNANKIFTEIFNLSNDYLVGDILICDIKLMR